MDANPQPADPSPDEIAARCAEIRKTWGPARRRRMKRQRERVVAWKLPITTLGTVDGDGMTAVGE